MFIFLLLSQPVIDAHDLTLAKAAFEPYRQCVIKHARGLYSTGRNFSEIITEARKACAEEQAETAMTSAANAVDAALTALESGVADDRPAPHSDVINQLDDELLMELGKDFVAKESK